MYTLTFTIIYVTITFKIWLQISQKHNLPGTSKVFIPESESPSGSPDQLERERTRPSWRLRNTPKDYVIWSQGDGTTSSLYTKIKT